MKLLKDVLYQSDSPSELQLKIRSILIKNNQTRLCPMGVMLVAREAGIDYLEAAKELEEVGTWHAQNEHGDVLDHNVIVSQFKISDMVSVDYFEGWSFYLIVGQKVGLFKDQLDGDRFALDWLRSLYQELYIEDRELEMVEHGLSIREHIVDGRLITLWKGERCIAQATIKRTPLNWTQVTLSRNQEHEVFEDVFRLN